jgi:thymidylate synthase
LIQYHQLLRHILDNGAEKDDRTGTGTLSVFGYQMRFDLQQGFPLITTKKIHLKSSFTSCSGSYRRHQRQISFRTAGVTIWDEWADERGDLGAGVRPSVAIVAREGWWHHRSDLGASSTRSRRTRTRAG